MDEADADIAEITDEDRDRGDGVRVGGMLGRNRASGYNSSEYHERSDRKESMQRVGK